MKDTRLTNMRECLAEAMRCAELQVAGLIRDTEIILADLEEDCEDEVHNLLDIAQARQFLTAARDHISHTKRLMGLAVAEFKTMEVRP